ncbi:MAG: TIM barrel protein [Candidatus Woesearchaeota archaeon]
MQFSNNGYYSAMDRLDNTQFFASNEPADLDEEGNPIVSDDALNFSPQEIGLTTNPMQNPLESFKAQIKHGIGRIEFGFMGQGKGSAQNPTPESVSAAERRDMRELLKINDIKTSTHAAVHANSLAGFTNKGFDSASRAQALKEINKAIHFAGEATRGGAIVFHMHEWQRPLSELNGPSGAKFRGYDEEDKEAVLFAVDKRTGDAVSVISKNREIYRPVYETAKDRGLVGNKDSSGHVLREGDWVDIGGNYIPKDAPPEKLFNRVPKFNKEGTNFVVEPVKWADLVKETDEWNAAHPDRHRSPEEMFAIVDTENKVLQAKGASLFHAQSYEDYKYRRDELAKQYDLYKKLKNQLPEDEHWKIDSQLLSGYRDVRPGESGDTYFEREIKSWEDKLRHVHESSASADVQARQAQELIDNIESAKKYGLKKTAETISAAGIKAMEVYNKNKDKYDLDDPLYVAPENWNQQHYGSHPDEMRAIVTESRRAMAEKLKIRGYSQEEADKLAETHIKATLDIGHLNSLRYNFVADDPNKSDAEFDKWMLDQTEKLVKDGIVGHIHLSDNFGFDDEHLTPGQGNVPMKEFLKKMEERGMKDIILEVGSYNANTAYMDTFAFTNAPVYGAGSRQRFAQTRNAHFGQTAPGFFIAGAYVPSNDWRPWTDIPLE